MKKITLSLFIILILFCNSVQHAQKREFRASWTASISNLDWPSARNLTVTQQKNELIAILDKLQSLNINAVFLQIRPEADALYSSSIEPWSYWLTGAQGTAPSPLYDPLQYAIDEAHSRGIELHAWLNPFRAVSTIGQYTLAAGHVTNLHPDWILTFTAINQKMLDPGKSLVRSYIVSIVSDIVTRYDVDGIIFDDYFYPYPNSGAGFTGITTEDASTFASEPRGFTNISNWRRDNVNLLIQTVNTTIKGIKPFVKFGVSPFGIWKNGVPSGIVGLDAYSAIYCDALAWLTAQTVDYISPQLYWPHGGAQDYAALMPWWANQLNGRHLYVSHALSKYSTWNSNEIPNQIILNRATSGCYGSVYYRTEYFDLNPYNIVNTLQTNYYKNSALAPSMSWLGGSAPAAPTDLEVTSLYSGNMLSWNNPASSNLKFTVIYRDDTTPVDISDQENIIDVIPSVRTYFHDQSAAANTTYYYSVTSVNKYDLESDASGNAASNTSANYLLLDNFEVSAGHFDRSPTYSGSTSGISVTSSAARTTAQSFNSSTGSLQVILKDEPSSSNNWFVRLLSGSGIAANNVPIDNDYTIGFWAKTSSASAGAQISLLVRDEGTLEKGIMVNVINDGNWHLYKWDLNDNSQWTAFTGNGQINGTQVTLDAIVFTANNASPDWTIYIDDVHAEEFVPLPVELTGFNAEVSGSGVYLSWSTATELNNFGFEIERSTDNSEWVKIGFVEGHGNSYSNKEYFFVDKNIESGKYFYRLKQVDLDGSYEYSRVLTVEFGSAAEFELSQNYPNPFNPNTVISWKMPEAGKVSLKIFNSLGEEIRTLIEEFRQAGNHSINFSADPLMPSGVYFYKLNAGRFSITKKMLLMK